MSAILLLLANNAAPAASSSPPQDFAGVPLGSSLKELKSRYPEVSRNPDSDREFQVYQVPALREVRVKSPAAFQIYHGRVVGGQILLDSKNAGYWFDAMVSRYGPPDNCSYCNDPELAIAVWKWPNGASIKIGSEMLTELTSEGASQRAKWLSRDDSNEVADNGDETTDEAGPEGPVKPHKRLPGLGNREASNSSPSASHAKTTGWRGYYDDMNNRLERWLGWNK